MLWNRENLWHMFAENEEYITKFHWAINNLRSRCNFVLLFYCKHQLRHRSNQRFLSSKNLNDVSSEFCSLVFYSNMQFGMFFFLKSFKFACLFEIRRYFTLYKWICFLLTILHDSLFFVAEWTIKLIGFSATESCSYAENAAQVNIQEHRDQTLRCYNIETLSHSLSLFLFRAWRERLFSGGFPTRQNVF